MGETTGRDCVGACEAIVERRHGAKRAIVSHEGSPLGCNAPCHHFVPLPRFGFAKAYTQLVITLLGPSGSMPTSITHKAARHTIVDTRFLILPPFEASPACSLLKKVVVEIPIGLDVTSTEFITFFVFY